jgi:hypothetical protein
MSKISVVYRITDNVTGLMYIGSKRVWLDNNNYFCSLRARKRKVELQNAWKLATITRPETFSFEILFECDYSDITLRELYEKEYEFQKLYDVVMSTKYVNAGYANGRFCNNSIECSAETRKKLSIASTGKIMSISTRNKLREKATNISEETREKRRLSLLGHTHSEEAKRKMSMSKRNMSEHTKAKIGFASRNRSVETRQKISNSLKNLPKDVKNRISEKLKNKPTWHTKIVMQNIYTLEEIHTRWRLRKNFSNTEYKMIRPERYCHMFNDK